jgi:hypothetical protein
VTEFLRNQRKTNQKGRKTPHPIWKNIIFSHFKSNQQDFIFSKIELIGGFPLIGEKITSLIRIYIWYMGGDLDSFLYNRVPPVYGEWDHSVSS